MPQLTKTGNYNPHNTNPKTHQPKTSRNILIAFLLNLGFSIYEFIGGSFTGSTAIMSDAVHDLGDAISIGLSFFLERKSSHTPDQKYTYGYLRYSLIGSTITTLILLFGSSFVIINAILRLFHPAPINYDGMIILAVVGATVNFFAAHLTSRGESLNQKSVNLHMLEDVLGWVVVLIGAIIMKFVDITYIDPILSICVTIFIVIHAVKNLAATLAIFLEKTPAHLSLPDIKQQLLRLPNIQDVHHFHAWSIDESHHFATLHVVTNRPSAKLKHAIRHALLDHHISHVTIEFESPQESCLEHECHLQPATHTHHHHH